MNTKTADALSSVLLKATVVLGRLIETGGTGVLNGDSGFSGIKVLLTSGLAVTGIMSMGIAQSSAATLEVTEAVGAGVIIATPGQQEREQTTVVLDHASIDHGTVTLQNALFELKGLTGVDSVSYRNSMLTMYHGDTALASVKLVGLADPVGTHDEEALLFGKNAAGSLFAHPGVLRRRSQPAAGQHSDAVRHARVTFEANRILPS